MAPCGRAVPGFSQIAPRIGGWSLVENLPEEHILLLRPVWQPSFQIFFKFGSQRVPLAQRLMLLWRGGACTLDARFLKWLVDVSKMGHPSAHSFESACPTSESMVPTILSRFGPELLGSFPTIILLRTESQGSSTKVAGISPIATLLKVLVGLYISVAGAHVS